MHQEFYYIPKSKTAADELIFQGDELHHLARVKRKQKGDIVWIVDGQGSAHEAEILYVARNEARARILKTRRRIGEPVSEITLAQSVMKGDRFDWLIEKATEIGVKRIIPVISKHSVVAAGRTKVDRWNRIALAAMKQCGRSILPEISQPMELIRVFSLGTDCQYRLIAHSDDESQSLNQIDIPTTSRITPKAVIIIGPEGGFSQDEIDLGKENGFYTVRLGPRRLRAETAGLVLLTMLMTKLDEME